MNTQEMINTIETKKALTQAQIKHYHTHGYVIVKNFFSKEELEPLCVACHGDPDLANSGSEIDYGGTGFKLSAWTELGDSMLGMIPRMARMVDAAEALEGEACYHWHSKIVLKKPTEGDVRWHQGFGTWYEDGCLFPKLVSACVAVNNTTRENGCLQIIKDSHHLGRLDNVMIGNSCATDPERLAVIHERMEREYCEMEQGDAVFFHANTLHGSDINTTDGLRVLLFSTYNVTRNEPYHLENQQHHRYRPLRKISDAVLENKAYNTIFETRDFLGAETNDNPKSGIGIRHGRSKQ